MEVSFDPNILERILCKQMGIIDVVVDEEGRMRMHKAARFVVKVALKYLPPKQRKVFFSVWCRSGGQLSAGVMSYSRRMGQSHFTNYTNYRKSLISLRNILNKTGYGNFLVTYIKEGLDDYGRTSVY
jgi:hypothetical protein